MKNVSQVISHTQGHELLLGYENALKNMGINPNDVTSKVIKEKLITEAVEYLVNKGFFTGSMIKNHANIRNIIILNLSKLDLPDKFGDFSSRQLGIDLYLTEEFFDNFITPFRNITLEFESRTKLRKIDNFSKDAFEGKLAGVLRGELNRLTPIDFKNFVRVLWSMLFHAKFHVKDETYDGLLIDGTANLFYVKLKDGSTTIVKVKKTHRVLDISQTLLYNESFVSFSAAID